METRSEDRSKRKRKSDQLKAKEPKAEIKKTVLPPPPEGEYRSRPGRIIALCRWYGIMR
jgi:hypothetical protein